MSGNLQFSPQQARSIGRSIKQKGDQADSLIKQLDKDIKSVEGWWKGDSARAFVDEFNQLKPALDKLVVCVNNISTQINKVADVKEQSERDIASALRR